jgi:hypothetical protein
MAALTSLSRYAHDTLSTVGCATQLSYAGFDYTVGCLTLFFLFALAGARGKVQGQRHTGTEEEHRSSEGCCEHLEVVPWP